MHLSASTASPSSSSPFETLFLAVILDPTRENTSFARVYTSQAHQREVPRQVHRREVLLELP